jgi:two-component system response regulator YesN
MLNTIKEYLSELNNGIAFINHFNCITVLLGNTLDLGELISIANTIKSRIQNVTVTIGIGKTYKNPNEISISYRQAKSALRYESRMGIGSIIPITYVEPDNHITYRFPLKKEELLVYTVVIGDKEKAQRLLSEIFYALKSCGELPEKLLPKIILDILVSINRYASEQKIPINDVFSKVFSVNIISEKNTLDEAYDYLKKVIEDFTDHINDSRKGHDNQIFELGKKYADTYYFEPISLSKTAQYAETTPDYLNNLFIEKASKSFYDYSIQARIEKAKYYILETNLSDREISKKVGYDDARHFSRIFYKFENESLESFRIKNKK